MATPARVVAAAREQTSSYRGGSGRSPLHGASSVWTSFDFEFGVMWMKDAPRLVGLLGLLGLVSPLWGVSMERSLPLQEDPDPERHSCCWCKGQWRVLAHQEGTHFKDFEHVRQASNPCEFLVEMGQILIRR